MSTDRIVINDTVRITVKFKDIDTSGNEVDLSPVPPVAVVIKNSAGTTVESGNATASSSSVYTYDFTPASSYTLVLQLRNISRPSP
jgi:hypothetical protein